MRLGPCSTPASPRPSAPKSRREMELSSTASIMIRSLSLGSAMGLHCPRRGGASENVAHLRRQDLFRLFDRLDVKSSDVALAVQRPGDIHRLVPLRK